MRLVVLACTTLGVLLLYDTPQTKADYLLAAAVTPPGSDPNHNGPVLLWQFTGTGPLTPLPTIPGRPDTLLNDPFGVAFSSQGELFVGNREGAVGGGHGSIARFTFDAAGNYLPNGNITGNGLEAVHSVTFSPTGELFAANLFNNRISRFVFDASGNALPNGVITFDVGSQLIGLAFSPGGELFTTTYRDVSRYVFDADGNAIFNGSFTIPGETRLHGLAFSASGELFVTSIDNNIVYRHLFDADGNPVPNGSFSVPTPVGLAFSPEGELFVSSHFQNHLISRFLFDASGNVIPNGTIDTPDSMGSVAVVPFGGGGGGGAGTTSNPEPSSLGLLGLGFVGMLGYCWRRRKRVAGRRDRQNVGG
jgi:WD40 repeat protein